MGTESTDDHSPLPNWPAIALVLGTAAPILVLEILAGGALAIATVPIVHELEERRASAAPWYSPTTSLRSTSS